jgi:predicted DCC family thiol-disulfide oxidoreductase YuxK
MERDKVYYDESCYVCSLEINTIRKRGEACGIEFVDISSEEFKNSKNKVWNDFDTEMIGEFSEDVTVGMETFRRMYEKMGFRRAVRFSRLPVIREMFNLGYHVFAHWVRPYLPRKR